MRNLRNIQHDVVRIPAGDLTAAAFDLDNVVCAFGPTEDSPAVTLKRHTPGLSDSSFEVITSWDAPSPNPDLAYDRILDLHCFSDSRTIVVIFEGGDIVVVREEPGAGEDAIEIVGSVDAGIAAAKWSPDEELLVIATKADTVLFMTRDYDARASVTLSPEDLKVSNHVDVGWGKKETQFKGRGVAKTLRDPTMPEHIDQGKLSQVDDDSVSITWRGDGELLAINSILNVELKRRVIRVFTREGVLESVSEPVDGLEGSISWKPSGQLIAGIQRKDEGIDVVFFERNGLRHGEFGLRLTKEECATIGQRVSLLWNTDSTVLTAVFTDRVQLWTMGNYHYYLKQEILLHQNDLNQTFKIAWHPETAPRLICYNGDELHLLDHAFIVSRGSVIQPNDDGLVAVIDGRNLKFTPLSVANIPPPMALDEISLSDSVIDVAFSPSGSEAVVLQSNGQLTFWQFDYSIKSRQMGQSVGTVSLHEQHEASLSTYRQVVALQGGSYAILSSRHGGDAYQIVKDGEVSELMPFEESTLALVQSSKAGVVAQDKKGMLWRYNIDEVPQEIIGLPSPCAHSEIWENENGSVIACGLSSQGILHVVSTLTQQRLKVTGCTSFILTRDHLIFTTSQHLLKFVHLHDGELEVPNDEPETDERCRNIERGARIVTAMPSSHALVLQMPRGNLETIYPRALVLAGIRSHIRNRDYKKAFTICRTQRVDMNILHDYVPEQFIADIGLFIKQVKKVEYIDLFLSSLSEEDVSQTLYKDTADVKPVSAPSDITKPSQLVKTSKVNRICDGFLIELEKEAARLQNTVTAHVCKSPPDLSAGLLLISKLRQEGQQKPMEQAVDHICFLADVNQLYDTALGLYDLDVTLLVAQQSQKDPREYLPYLQNLQSLSQLRRQFQIDHDLRRHSKAILHLHAMDEFEELKTYMIKYDLYSAAMEIYRYDAKRMVELMRLYAEHSSSNSRHREAGIAYEFVKDYESACESYRAAAMWQECLAVAELVPVSPDALKSLATDLAESLEQSKHFSNAAIVHIDYLDDLTSAAHLLCKACQFSEAIRLVTRHKQTQLLVDVIDTGLVEVSATMTELLAEMKTQLQNQVPRLRELRQKKLEDPMAFLDGGADGVDIPDDISIAPTEASTTGTFMTRYTNRSTGTLATNATRKTSRNRRREERKRAQGKKGTVYEEEYLINSIARLVERLNATSEDIGRLVQGLMRRAMRERALAVEQAMIEVQSACQLSIDEVFSGPTIQPTQAAQSNGGATGDELSRPAGGQGILWDALHSAGGTTVKPIVKPFERLSMLS